MNIKLLLQHGTSIYDATPILEGRVEWFASVMGKAGRLKFRVVRDGIVNFVEGDRVSFYVDSVLRFSGFVMTKERTSEQIISVTAYDQKMVRKIGRPLIFWFRSSARASEMMMLTGRPTTVM